MIFLYLCYFSNGEKTQPTRYMYTTQHTTQHMYTTPIQFLHNNALQRGQQDKD